MSYYYQAFGLIIKSEFEIPMLMPAVQPSNVDVIIKLGKVNQQEISFNHYGFDYGESYDLLICVNDGAEIIIENNNNLPHHIIYPYLLSSPMGALLHQRGYLVLHGNCIDTRDGGVIFVGNSGAGKSTLAMNFLQDGYTIFSDDICAIDVEKAKIYPSYPFIRLCDDALDKLNIDKSSLVKVKENVDKYYYPHDRSLVNPIDINTVIEITHSNDSHYAYINTLVDKFSLLSKHIYKKDFFLRTNTLNILFDRISKLLKNIYHKNFATAQRAINQNISPYYPISFYNQIKSIFKCDLFKNEFTVKPHEEVM